MKRCLVISQRKVIPTTDGALVYTYGLLKLLNKMKFNTVLVNFIEDKDYSDIELRELSKYVEKVYTCPLKWRNTALNMSFKYPNNVRKYTRNNMFKLIKDIKSKNDFDLIIIDHLQMFEYAKLFKDKTIILHTHNVESNIWREYANKCKGIVKCLVKRSADMTYKYECEALKKATRVTSISEEDASQFKKMAPEVNVKVLRGYNEFDILKTKEDIFNKQDNLLFIGSYGWYPNEAAAMFLIKELMPALRARNVNVKLFLVGKSPTKDMIEFSKKYEDIIVTGMVETVDPYIKGCDIFVNAVTEGSGLNIKMIEAMGKGIPIITSAFGMRGFDVEDNKECLIYSNCEDCVQKIIDLLEGREKAYKLQINARKYYEKFISPSSEIIKYFNE